MTRSFHWNVAAVQETTFANNDANLSVEQAKKHQKSAGTRNTPTLVVAPLWKSLPIQYHKMLPTSQSSESSANINQWFFVALAPDSSHISHYSFSGFPQYSSSFLVYVSHTTGVEQDPISGFFSQLLSSSSYDCKPYMTQLVRQFPERVFM